MPKKVTTKRWQLFPQDNTLSAAIGEKLGVSPTLGQLLLNRGIRSLTEAKVFLSKSLDLAPFMPKESNLAGKIIQETIDAKKRILVYGDYDVDGMTSTSMMVAALRALNADVIFHIPSRFEEGYGLHHSITNRILKEKVSLLITLDCGVSNVSEIQDIKDKTTAKVIVFDHHTLPDTLPPYDTMLNPKLLSEDDPDAGLCTAGIVYRFLQSFCGDKPEAFTDGPFLALFALGTIADIAPLTGNNRALTHLGLEAISKRAHRGINALLLSAKFDRHHVSPRDVGFVIAPRLNAAGRLSTAKKGVELLLSPTQDDALKIAETLERINLDRRSIDENILNESMKTLEGLKEEPPVIVLSGKNWHAGVIGITASKLVDRMGKPAVIMADDGKLARGSARSIGEVDIYHLLKSCSVYFESFGGHKQAAGFSILPEKIEPFMKALLEAGKKTLNEKDLQSLVEIDCKLPPKDMNLEMAQALGQMEPFGHHNPQPIFFTDELKVIDSKTVGDGTHLKVRLQDSKETMAIDGIGFGLAHKLDLLYAKRPLFAFHLGINQWSGRVSPQLELVDIK